VKASHTLNRLCPAFDDPNLVANAGLILPVTLAHRLGLPELLRTIDLGPVPGPFRLYKFRILTPAGEQEIKAGAMPKRVENTPGNLTVVGAVLKKIGLDELPQFLNVLTGKMSLVGPRPKPPAEYKEEIECGHEFRAQLQAGLTGPAQVLKGTVRTGDDSVRADLEYADLLRKGSQLQILAYDAKTLLKTVRVLLRATGE